jgi:type I restriction enzyme S subunit
MNDWPTFTVAELQRDGVLLVEDGNHGEYRPRPREFDEEGTPFIRAADLAGGSVQFDQAGRINDVALVRIRKGIGRPGDILFSHKGTVGKLARVPVSAPPFVCSPQTTFWRVLEPSRLRRDYLYAYMRSRAFINQWWARKGETDMADYVSLTAQRQLRVVVPPVSIQRRIAGPIENLDDLIENSRRRAEVLDETVRTIYHEWFVRFRFPGHETAAFIDSALGAIPENWAIRRSGDLVSEGVLDIGDGYRAKNSEMTGTDDGFPFVRVGNLRDGWLSLEGCDRLPDEYRARLRSKVSRSGDVVISMKGTVGRHVLIHDWDGEMAYSPQVSFWRSLAPERFSPAYLYSWIQSDNFIEQCAAVKGATDMADYVNLTDQRRMAVVQAPREIMAAFTELVQPMLLAAGILRAQRSQLASLRDRLLPKLVTGQIDVSAMDLGALVEDSVA